jgi:hypothetical protein
MTKETEYYVRQGKEVDETEITKFQDGANTPSAVYVVFHGKSGRWMCDCPAGSNGRNCKHVDWVQSWIAQGKPTPYSIRINKKGQVIT